MDATSLTLYHTHASPSSLSREDVEILVMAGNLFDEETGFEGVCFEANECLAINCATNLEVALVKGAEVKARANLDLAGSFKPSMRECDEEAVSVNSIL
ncbi:hypothetical protein SASPL_111959 [Salvia splendens]|uniref:Uncharacterized protein n=1 Tax=Salvia splendens TaxID=180675 RepID=A0A8X8YDI7_SALSN|nr:hypothetical protein SASPL_111959 [Salvia splendens]